MKIFSIELSSRVGSLALIENHEVLDERSWEENQQDRQQLFDAMTDMAIKWDEVDVFAVGCGPGAFSGMRIAFSVANSLAAPLQKPVYALNSGAALAEEYGEEATAVIGDARRGKVWAGIFSKAVLKNKFELLETDELRGFIPEGTLVLSSDHDRLADLLADFRTREAAEPVFPRAAVLGTLVSRRLEQGMTSEPLEPLYMHPPVFVAPRFPAK